jgi:hypothetical protein
MVLGGICGFASITICSLIISMLEDTNLTSKLKVQGLKINRIVVTKGPSNGSNQVRDGNQDLIFSHTCVFIECSFSHLVL